MTWFFWKSHLVFIDLAVLKLRLALLLESDDDEGDEDVHEEEREHDEVDNIKYGHFYAVVQDGAVVFLRGRHRILQDPVNFQINQV